MTSPRHCGRRGMELRYSASLCGCLSGFDNLSRVSMSQVSSRSLYQSSSSYPHYFMHYNYMLSVLRYRLRRRKWHRRLIRSGAAQTWGDSDAISSYHRCFSAILWGKLCEMIVILTSLSYSDNTDIFLSQLIQFYSNSATNLHQLTTHSTTVLPHEMEIVLRPQISDVTSPYGTG